MLGALKKAGKTVGKNLKDAARQLTGTGGSPGTFLGRAAKKVKKRFSR